MVPLIKTYSIYPPLDKIRFIAVLPILSKLYTKIINKRLQDELEERNLIHSQQAGFRRGNSKQTHIKALASLL